MKRLILGAFLAFSTSFGEIVTIQGSDGLNDENLQIFDIRSQGEWQESGVLENATLVEYRLADGSINPAFFDEIKANLKPGKTPALICATGRRSLAAAEFLDKNHKDELGGKIINLDGGMTTLIKNGVKTIEAK